jgi:uncharacterized protein YifN (PemK superfamily)
MDWPRDEELEKAGWVKISRRERRILSAPRVRQYYWIDFPHDAYAPEFVGEHPGIVIRGGALHDTCIIVPVTSKPQPDMKYVHKLSKNPNPVGHSRGVDAHVICSHLYTVNICRLRPVLDTKGNHMYPRIDQLDFEAICGLVRLALFPPGPVVPEPAQAAEKPAEKQAKAGKAGRPILGLKVPPKS